MMSVFVYWGNFQPTPAACIAAYIVMGFGFSFLYFIDAQSTGLRYFGLLLLAFLFWPLIVLGVVVAIFCLMIARGIPKRK